MNPFMMLFGPMGIGFMGGGCGCGVNMPYYGQNDMLTFMNFPVFRNTSSDYLLDPRLALMQAQQSFQQGGSIFGNSYLPLFNNFPGAMNSPMSPWWNPSQRTETEEEKKNREKKEAEGKKPEAQKAEALKKNFDRIKKIADANTNFVSLDENIIKKAEEAMKKETAEEQLTAMKEVIAAIPEEILRKSVMADEEVVKRLKAAGYNFNYKNNKYSLPANSITDNLNDVRDNIISKRDYTALGTLAANIMNGTTPILAAISSWNNTQEEKGILKFISENMPTDAPAAQLKLIVPQIVNGLIKKADEYSGCKEIKKERDNVAKLKDELTRNFNAANLKTLSAAFESLYARLRMQEAVKVRDYIVNNNDFKALNDAKEGVINNKMVVEETYSNLKEEGISNPPSEDKLDKIASVTAVTINEEGVVDIDKEYEGNPQGLIDEYLVEEKGILSKVEGTKNIYQTKDYDGKGSGVKYYTINNDNKLIEVKKAQKGYAAVKGANEVKAEDIEKYNNSIEKLKSLLDDKSIEPYNKFTCSKPPYPVFKATGANEFYALIGNTLGKIKNCTELKEDNTNKKIHAKGTNKTLDQLTESDLTEFETNNVKSKKKVEAEKKEKEKQDIEKVTELKFSSLKELKSNKKLDEVSNTITGKKGERSFIKLNINGYFKDTKNNRYYRYNANKGQLVYLENVTEINNAGYMKCKNGSYKECTEAISDTPISDEELVSAIQEYGKKFAKDANGCSTADEDIDMCRKLNTIIARNNPIYTVNFIKGYKSYGGFWSYTGICRQIATEYGIEDGKTSHHLNTKKHYIQQFAKMMIKVVDTTSFDRDSDDYRTLEKIANGEFITKLYSNGNSSFDTSKQTNILTTAIALDEIIEKIIKTYDKEYSNTDTDTEKKTIKL